MSEDLPHILFAPYLILPDDSEIGPWRFIRFSELDRSDALPDVMRKQVLDLVAAYRVDDGLSSAGAVVYPAGGEIGSPFDRSDMDGLQKAILVGVIANNPAMAASEEDQPDNAGHMAMTTENALLYGHPIGGTRSYVVSTGAIARQTSFRTAQESEDLPKVAPPVDLHLPLLSSFDDDLAQAALNVLGRKDVDARRLSRALDWYSLCFSNAVAISLDARITALRCAFEVLTGAGDKTKKVVRAVEELLRDDSTMAVTYEPFWAKGPILGTPDGVWMTAFSELRNAIVHGDEVPAELWEYEGLGQEFQALDRLLRGLKVFLAGVTGDESLRKAYGDRKLMQKWRETVAYAESLNPSRPD